MLTVKSKYILLNVIMLGGIILNVIVLNVVTPIVTKVVFSVFSTKKKYIIQVLVHPFL
jgi:hypothetical protein